MAYLLRIEEGGMLVPALWLLDLLTAYALKETLAVIVTVLQDKRRTVAYVCCQVTEVRSPARHCVRIEDRYA